MKKLTMEEFWKIMCDRCEAVHNGTEKEHIHGVIVYSADNATNGKCRTDLGDLTPLESRSYRVSSDNKCFGSWYCGYSLFGASLDGKWFERLEHNDWDVEYCYIEE